jgi:hypothetical protein
MPGQGAVWWRPAPHKSSPSYRSWLVVSDTTHPFAHTECIGVAMTTQEHEQGIPVPETEWIRSGSETESFVSPWYTATLKHRDLGRKQGELSRQIVSDVGTALHDYTSLPAK